VDGGHRRGGVRRRPAFIRDRGITYDSYRQQLSDRRRPLDALLPDETALPDEHRTTVAAAWSLSIDAADAHPPPRPRATPTARRRSKKS
jgi:hypothetical protein